MAIVHADRERRDPGARCHTHGASGRLGKPQMWVVGETDPVDRQSKLSIAVAIMQQRERVGSRARDADTYRYRPSRRDRHIRAAECLPFIDEDIVVFEKIVIVGGIDLQAHPALAILEASRRYQKGGSRFADATPALRYAKIGAGAQLGLRRHGHEKDEPQKAPHFDRLQLISSAPASAKPTIKWVANIIPAIMAISPTT